jgi:hypothetical protein
MRLPPELRALAATQDWVLTGTQLRLAGLHPSFPSRMVASRRWVRLRRNAYLVEPRTARSNAHWVVARSLVLTQPDAVVAGVTAAHLWGLAQVPDGAPEVVVAPGRAVTTRPSLRPHVRSLADQDVVELRGIRLTSLHRTLVDLACAHDRLEVIALLDAALGQRKVTNDELMVLAERAQGRAGSAHVADLWALADGRAESGLESRVRLRCIDGGVPPDDLQVPIYDGAGNVVARVDMIRRRRGAGRSRLLAIEADGASVHATPEALYRDRTRGNGLAAASVDSLRFTWRDTCDPFTVPDTVRAAS